MNLFNEWWQESGWDGNSQVTFTSTIKDKSMSKWITDGLRVKSKNETIKKFQKKIQVISE